MQDAVRIQNKWMVSQRLPHCIGQIVIARDAVHRNLRVTEHLTYQRITPCIVMHQIASQ